MKTVYILVHNKAWNESYAVDICIKYISESKESAEKEMERLIREDEDFDLEEARKNLTDNYNNYQDWYKNKTSWDSNTKRRVPYNVDIEVQEYEKNFYDSFWIEEVKLDTQIDLSMGSYYE